MRKKRLNRICPFSFLFFLIKRDNTQNENKENLYFIVFYLFVRYGITKPVRMDIKCYDILSQASDGELPPLWELDEDTPKCR